MHELSYATSMLNTILDTVKNHNLKNVKRVSKIKLEIGELTFINVEQLKFAFQVISKSTICEGAEIEVEFIKPYVTCKECEYSGELEELEDLIISCPKCGSLSLKIEGGKEFNIKNITVEFEED
ncbi:MAG TPA: hydrogenase maturation nickel metallochaperone HypA [Methanothermococcus okinawensis]|uniref:Hydrogenase maturation factor HypA n=1 Tax=Methanothermococcus okinawensis TaxID=155863 RepID=A0A833DZW3_9EURY|nr:hydrogenase maturation nickel metallochaperone HypA [Methanococcaceae archaeon]HIP84317.1 hydrogenase maturation nickel metallochaperone HypA [Methanothermococcus okinawensis]HIP90970.1 hydrogenase maturation nickel metallochaperone HypA [Methanothermococcus okinawensis]